MQVEPAQTILDPAVNESRGGDGAPMIELSGAWDIRALESRAQRLKLHLAREAADPGKHWDLSGIQRLDHIGALLIWQAWGKHRPARLASVKLIQLLFLSGVTLSNSIVFSLLCARNSSLFSAVSISGRLA